MKLTFVCSGNTCRSPLAVAAWQVVLHEVSPVCRARLEQIEVRSAGLNARAGHRASAMAQLVAAGWGADLSEHRAQSWQPPLQSDETLVTMTLDQAAQLRFRLGAALAPGAQQIATLGEFCLAMEAPAWSKTRDDSTRRGETQRGETQRGETQRGETRDGEAHIDIPDPYGGSSEAYEECGARILRGVRALALELCGQ